MAGVDVSAYVDAVGLADDVATAFVLTSSFERRLKNSLKAELNSTRWPVKTGRSKRGWKVQVTGARPRVGGTLGPLRVRLRLYNPVEYAEWVRRKGRPVGESSRLLERAMRREFELWLRRQITRTRGAR